MPTTIDEPPDAAASKRTTSIGDGELPGDESGSQAGGEVGPEGLHDRAQVLPREHLGRRQERRLPARVGDREHRLERDEGLARSDLALHEPVHRDAGGQIGLDRRPDGHLVVGQRERQPFGELGRRLTRNASHGDLRPVQRTLPQQRGLQHERLVEPQRVLRLPPVGVDAGVMDEFERPAELEQPAGILHFRRHRVVERRQSVDLGPDDIPDLLAVESRGGAVDRHRRLGPGSGGLGVGLEIFGERLVHGMRQLAGRAVDADLAGEDRAHPGLESVRGLPAEERELQGARAVGDDHLDEFAVAVAHRPRLDAAHLRHDRDRVADAQRVERSQIAAGRIAAGVVAEQIADRLESESLLEQRCHAGAERRQQARVERSGHGSRLVTTSRVA